MLSAIDEYDIRESFRALDVHRLGKIDFDDLYKLYLGLGFGKVSKIDFRIRLREVSPVHRQNPAIPVSVDIALLVLDSFPSRDRSEAMSTSFSLVDRDKKGYITPEDLKRLSEEVGDPVSLQDAETMLKTLLEHQELSGNHETLTESALRTLLSPPSP